MIETSLMFIGDSSICTCAIHKGDKIVGLESRAVTGAKALNKMIGRLARHRLKGERWIVRSSGWEGAVPSYPFRSKLRTERQIEIFGGRIAS